MKSIAEIICVILSTFPYYAPTLKEEDVKSKKLCGNSNQLYLVTLPSSYPNNTFLVRYFGKLGDLIDTRIERNVFIALCKMDFGLKQYKLTNEYRVEQYIASVPFSGIELKNSISIMSFAKKICQFHHSNELSDILKSSKFQKPYHEVIFDDWVEIITNKKKEIISSLKTNLEKNTLAELFEILSSKQYIEQKLLCKDLCAGSIVNSHNDIHCCNLLMHQDKTVSILDFEYTSRNYMAMDVGSYASESCTDCSLTEYPFYAHREEARLSNDEIMLLCCEYKKEEYKIMKPTIPEADYIIDQANLLYKQVISIIPLINLYWALWCMMMMDWNNISEANIVLASTKLQVYKELVKAQTA
jgi:thiamine kinase-like enzyme